MRLSTISTTLTRRLRACPRTQWRHFHASQRLRDAATSSEDEVARARAYCANLVKYDITPITAYIPLIGRKNERCALARSPEFHTKRLSRCLPRHSRLQRRRRPRGRHDEHAHDWHDAHAVLARYSDKGTGRHTTERAGRYTSGKSSRRPA